MAERPDPYGDPLDALDRINNLIYGDGAPLGSDNYFQIRIMCISVLKTHGRKWTVSTPKQEP